MYFIPSFKSVHDRLGTIRVNGIAKVNMPYDDLVDIIKSFLQGVAFEETWYLAQYPDVADAVKTGAFRSGRQHFIDVGYFEGRRPRDFEVDEKWYLGTYPDVAQGISKGEINSAHQHFNEHGYEEGRLPAKL